MLKFSKGIFSPTYYQLINRCPCFRHCPCSPESHLWPRALFPGNLPFWTSLWEVHLEKRVALVHIVRTMKCLNILARVTPCILGGHLGYRMESQVSRKLNEGPSLVLLVHAMNVAQSMPLAFEMLLNILFGFYILCSRYRIGDFRGD